MFILYISGTYMPAAGGAEISMYTLLRCMAERGHRVSVFTSTQVPVDPAYGSSAGIDVHYVGTENLYPALQDFCLTREVDLLATQNLWADLAIRFARNARIPSVYFARSADGRLDISPGGQYECSFVIANSRHVADFVRATWRRDAPVVRSIICLEDYRAAGGSHSFITMINPICTHKGGEVFRSIAEALKDRDFLAIQGWSHLRTGDRWNMALLRELASGLGSDVWVPEDADFSSLPNVRVWKHTADMRRVYAETRLLLVPSNGMESIPRVAIESMSNGIPVLGSAVGGLVELLSQTGILIRDYTNVNAWVDAIVSLDDPAVYMDASCSSKKYVEALDYPGEVSRCISLLDHVVHASNC